MKHVLLLIIFGLISTVAFAYGATENEDAEYNGIREIQVDAGTFEVDVQGTRGRKTSIDVRNESDNFRVLHSQSGDRLEIWVEGRFSLFSRPQRGRITLLVPAEALVQVRTSTGEVVVRDLDSDRLSVDTSTGDVMIADVAAPVEVETSTGSIEIVDSAGRFDINSTTGDIDLIRTTGNVSAQSSTGSHFYRDLIGDLSARSTTGSIEVDGLQGRLDLRTSTGSQEGRNIVLTGDSSFESSTGAIEIDFADSLETLEFDLRSTTGSIRVGREESQRQLYLGGTGFTIRGKSSTGSQEYATRTTTSGTGWLWYNPQPPMAATRVQIDLSFRDSGHLRTENHSFANLINVVHAELQLLERMCLPTTAIRPLVSLCETAAASFRSRQRAEQSSRDLEVFETLIEDALVDLEPKPEYADDAAEAVRILTEVLDDANLRVQETLSRHEIRRTFTTHESNQIESVIRAAAGTEREIEIESQETAAPLGLTKAVGRLVRELRRITGGRVCVCYRPVLPGNTRGGTTITIHTPPVPGDIVPEFPPRSFDTATQDECLKPRVALLYYLVCPVGMVEMDKSGSPFLLVSYHETQVFRV